MCGIAGICALNGPPVNRAEIAAQIETLVHRGPDEGGVFVAPDGRCGLGIRRLSIIDVAGGQQPLHHPDGSLQLVYNGETYNHRALRTELEALGHRPGSHSDAEAVLHGYRQWGAAGMLARLRGMFAFALWDAPRRLLLLARDRFGIKPLYYARHNGRLIFASEIKAILTQLDFPRRVNLPALQTLLTLGFVPGPETMFAGVFKLPPAHMLTVEAGQVTLAKYWSLTYQPDDSLTEADVVAQFLALLRESVELRLMSEVPLGALLSGGLDSGTLAALAQAGLHRPLKTVSIGFAESAYDEAARARETARFIGSEHQAAQFSAGDFNDYPQIMRHLESPQCSATALPIYRLYQACRAAGLTVVLTGEGADELLGGYQWHRGDALARRLLGLPSLLRRLLTSLPGAMSPAARRVLRRGYRPLARRFGDWLEVPGEGHRPALFSAAARSELAASFPPADWQDIAAGAARDPFHQLLWLDSQTRMVDFINFEVDKMSMAHSIEARVPFLDHKLWEFCATLPAHVKLQGRTEKYLLRQAARGLLPESIRARSKLGLAAPYAGWLQSPGLPDWAEAALSTAGMRRAGLFDAAAVASLRQQVQAGRRELAPLLMGVLSTQVWYEQFLQ